MRYHHVTLHKLHSRWKMRARAYLLPVLPILLTLGSSALSQPAGRWSIVRDSRSGLHVEYPAGLFSVPAGPTDRHPGQKFRTPDGRAEFAYYTFENSRAESPGAYLNRALVVDKRNIVYQRITPSFFVVSSIRGQNIYYSRCNFGRFVKCIFTEYPAQEKRRWDATVTRISHSLR